MTDQLKNGVSGVQEKAQDATKGTPVSGVQEKIKAGTDSVLSTVDTWGGWVAGKGKSVVDGIFPPEKRAAFLAKLQDFMLRNPKLSAFLGMNLALTGIPLGLFVLFSLSVFIFALVVALVVGLLAAVLFTLFMVGVALIVVFPTVMFTTGAACFLFLWGLGGYYILKWANGEGGGESKQAPEGQAIGDQLNSLTGGRLGGLMEGARSQNAKKGIEGYNDRYTKPANQDSKGEKGSTASTTGSDAQKHVGDALSNTTNAAGGVHKTATNASDTVSNANTGVAYAKGGLKGTTGLPIP
ncbi:hypothetical protein AC579_1690 [Pseudocercospora musae]|uniref:Uncharacterized protein n=1 Tax=Pseudocercospora musae TaxID=113226 RepID=A0A139I4R6_9PEZI|nr:hypothetical protein AC579_1690 [Pseudocercospora musae]